MKPINNEKEPAAVRAVSRDEEGKKKMEKIEIRTHNIETIKHVEKKLVDKGLARMDRHPVDGLGGIGRAPPKSGHGGKYTWEGPEDLVENELEAAPPAIDEKDPNYVDEEEEKDMDGLVVGVVEVDKAVEERKGVARVEVDPQLKV